MPRAETTTTWMAYNEALIEGAAAADVAQAAMLIAVVFIAREPGQFLDNVRRLAALRRRMGRLLERNVAARYERRRRTRPRREGRKM